MEDETVFTGVISSNHIVFEFVDNEICIDCEAIEQEINELKFCPHCDEKLNKDGECLECLWSRQEEYETIECFDHEKLIGDWIKHDGMYEPDKTKEFSAIVTDSTFNCIQVVWSKYIREVRSMCSPCFPNQADLDSGAGNIKCYDLPDYLVQH